MQDILVERKAHTLTHSFTHSLCWLTLQHRRAREDFAYMLKHMRDIRPDTTWEEAAAACAEEPEWGALDSEEEKRALFGEFIDKLKVRERQRHTHTELGIV